MEDDFQKINDNLLKELFTQYPKMAKEVMEQDMCDIDGDFLGFVDIYYHLSKIIPKDWTIIDFGCAYAPQAYYFRNHKKYIGVDVSDCKKFTFKNSEYITSSIEDYNCVDTTRLFAICSYVPADRDKLRKCYRNLFVYYPSVDSPTIKKKNT